MKKQEAQENNITENEVSTKSVDSSADAVENTEHTNSVSENDTVVDTEKAEAQVHEKKSPVPEVDSLEEESSESTAQNTANDSSNHGKRSILKKASNGRSQTTRTVGLIAGLLAVVLLAVSGFLSQYYKGKAMPGVVVAGVGVGAQGAAQLQEQLQEKVDRIKITLQSEEVTLEPTFEELGIQVDVGATVANTVQAKRHSGIWRKIAFWQKEEVALVTAVDEIKFAQYIETALPALTKPATDSQLTFDPATSTFITTEQADGEGIAIDSLRTEIVESLQQFTSPHQEVIIEKRKPNITQKSLQPLVAPANEILQRKIVLSGAGYTFQAQPAEIAAWITPTPQEDGSLKLVIDRSKIQAYVGAVGKRISQPPQDRKVLETESGEVVLQAGSNGTELTDQEQLAKAITIAIEERRDLAQQMNIQVAAFKTVSMEAFDRWVEVDLSEQRTTLYSGATPIQSFVISSGLAQYPTVVGEFKVWHKNVTQTMTGGSRAAGDFYNLPNVTWVTYFYKDYGFHTAYWHNNFGQPMSRGCINMREEDAKILYDFAPIGTTVIVHE